MSSAEAITHSGFVAIVGRPNVGKSTLLNHLLGQKISITSRRPQTTRHRILGIHTSGNAQFVFVDTPGLHRGGGKAMNRYLNRAADTTLVDVDVILFLVEGMRWTDEDQMVLDKVRAAGLPTLLIVNKVDQVTNKAALLPHLQTLGSYMDFVAIIPVSARRTADVRRVEAEVLKVLPEGAALFPQDQITDRSERFMAAEIVREKLTRRLGREIPYALTVEIEQFKNEGRMLVIHALIWVERPGQKAIVVGKGENLKLVGQDARKDMELAFDSKVLLKLWVKVKAGWSDDERALRSLGYED